MSSVHDAYVGVADEVEYGTAVAAARFYEFISEGVTGKYERIESEGVRAGNRVLRSDRWQPNPKGAEGDLKIEVLDAGFGFWLKHMLGAVATTGASAPYTHEGTVGDLTGKSFTLQVGRVADDGTVYPYTYEGGKVKSWELANQVDGVLQCMLDLDFEKETPGAGSGAYALATPTYVAGAKLLTFQGGTATLEGETFSIADVSVKGENGLKTDRWFLGNEKKEPLEEGNREITWSVKGEFADLSHVNRVASLTAAGAMGEIVLEWTAPTAGSLLRVTMPDARFDEAPVNADGAKVTEIALAGKALYNGTDSAITVEYITTDATP